jgi:hypothetical protein
LKQNGFLSVTFGTKVTTRLFWPKASHTARCVKHFVG